MKNKKKLIITCIQIFLILIFVSIYKSYVDYSLKPINVYGYSTALKSGTKITTRDLVKMPMSQQTLKSNMLTEDKLSQVVGKYTKMDIVKGSIVYADQLGDTSTVDKFASLDLSNSRVISLPIDYVSGVAGDFKRGDRLDLMYSINGATADKATTSNTNNSTSNDNSNTDNVDSKSFSYSKIFLQNVPVYQVNTGSGYLFTPHTDKDANATVKDAEGKEKKANSYEAIASISIIVTPEQAEEIKTRQNVGNITFLKRFSESENHDTLGFVIGKYGKIFAGNGNAETGNVQIADSFITPKNDSVDNSSDNNSNTKTDSKDKNNSTMATGNESVN